MSIQFHNTATREKTIFTPIKKGEATLYTCGPTVYNQLHVGNWVAYVRWDTLVRMLKCSDYTVTRVMNITDVGHLTDDADDGEDKMEKGARREGKTAWDIARLYTEDFMQGMTTLNLLPPEHITKATEHIDIQLDLVRRLKAKGYTYQIGDGIYFDTAKFPAYADFAQLNLDELKAGARVQVNHEKRNASDFALWKFTPAGQKRDMEWETPADIVDDGIARKGFPGWHLECSAMAMHYLGDTMDIHTGGIDHIPVHHTNEIAQSTAATDKPFAHFWLHNAHLLSKGTKISKSLNNGFTLEDIAEKGFSAMDFRMFVLQSHYRTESNFTWENVAAARARLQRWREVASLRWQTDKAGTDGDELKKTFSAAKTTILASLQDDMDTPTALRTIDQLFGTRENKKLPLDAQQTFTDTITFIDDLLGLRLIDSTPDISDAHKSTIAERETARTNKEWQRSDALRDELHSAGIGLNDTPGGSLWYWL